MLRQKLSNIKSILPSIFFLAIGLNIASLGATEIEQSEENRALPNCFVFPNEQSIKVHSSNPISCKYSSNESSHNKNKIFIVSQKFPSFLKELFSFDRHFAGLNATDQWSLHKFRFSKHLLKAQIQSSITSSKRKFHWELRILNQKQLITELADSTDLAHAIIFLHGDQSGNLYGYDGQKIPLDTFTEFAESIKSICIAACYLPIAIKKYAIRENFLSHNERYFIEAVNDDNEEYRIDNSGALIKVVEEVIENSQQKSCTIPVTQYIDR